MNSVRVRTGTMAGALAALFLVGLNLRLSLAGITPVIPLVRADTGMSSAQLGLVTGAAVAMFGLVAPLTPELVRRFGADPVLASGLALVCGGVAVRSVAIFGGTVVIGAGIALMNVVLPVIVKRDFAGRIALATAVYTSALNVGSAVAAAGAVPLAGALGGWRPAVLLTGVPALLALVVWVRHHQRGERPSVPARWSGAGTWRSPLAWQVTGFMGLQSLLYYVILAWLPTLCADAGMPASQAGAVLAVSQVGQLVGCITLPALLRGRADQRTTAVILAALTLFAYVGFTTAPTSMPWLFAAVLGLGQGGALVLALLLIGMRAPDTPTASNLSGMAQSVSYLVAAAAPPVVGLAYDATGGWTVPMAALCLLCVVEAIVGLLAGRPLLVPSVLSLRLGDRQSGPTAGDPV